MVDINLSKPSIDKTSDGVADLYLDLLKKTLTDYSRVDSDYANGIPPEFWVRKSPLKNLRNRLLIRFLKRSHMLVLREDRVEAATRRYRRENGLDWPVHADTMIGLKRLDNIQSLIKTILQDHIPGDLIETGVWKGGATIFMRAVLKAYGETNRIVWACDSFEGLPPPDPDQYPDDKDDAHHTYTQLAISQEQVAENFEKYGLLDDQVRFVKGYFDQTLSTVSAERFSLLRLDGDMYASTIVALDALYDRLSPGGFVIIDDYHLAPCRAAVTDFRTKRAIADPLVEIDNSAVYWRKTP